MLTQGQIVPVVLVCSTLGSFIVEFRRRPVAVQEPGVAGGAEGHGGYVPENGGQFENG